MSTGSRFALKAKHLTVPLVLSLLGLCIFLWFRHPDEVTDVQARLASIGLCLSVLPSILFVNRIGSGPIPFMPATGAFYLLAFILPFIVTTEVPGIAVTARVSTQAILVVNVALLSLYAGFYFVRQMTRYTGVLSVDVGLFTKTIHRVLWIFIILHLFEIFIIPKGELSSLGYVIDSGCLIGYAYLLCKWFLGQGTSRTGKALLGLCLTLEFIKRITSGSVAQPLELALLAGFAYWVARRRIPWVAVAVMAILAIKLQDAKMEYRRLAWSNGNLANASTLDQLKSFANLASTKRDTVGEDTTPGVSFIQRANQIWFLTEIIDQTPETVPYWRGETYKILFYKFIPRLIWPDKPVERLGVDFSLRYGLRNPSDETTSFNVPWIVELYANFGWTGIIAGMAVVGIGFAFLDREFNAPRMPLLDRMLGLVMLFDLVYQESNFSLMVGNKFLIYVSLALIFKFATQGTMRSRVMLEGRTGRTLPAHEQSAYSQSSGC